MIRKSLNMDLSLHNYPRVKENGEESLFFFCPGLSQLSSISTRFWNDTETVELLLWYNTLHTRFVIYNEAFDQIRQIPFWIERDVASRILDQSLVGKGVDALLIHFLS